MVAIVRVFLLLGIFCAAQAIAELDLDHGNALYQKTCAACHGADGNAPAPSFPKVAGQNSAYVSKQLADYQKNRRLDPMMNPVAQTLAANDIQDLLAYMASFKATNGGVDPSLRIEGEKIFLAGDIKRGIPACASCHGPAGTGNAEAVYPALAGQNPNYVAQQLQNFQDQKRTNDPNQMMEMIASKLTPQEIQALASYINGLRPS